MKVSEIILDKETIIDTPNGSPRIISDIYGLQQYISSYGNLEIELVLNTETTHWFSINVTA